MGYRNSKWGLTQMAPHLFSVVIVQVAQVTLPGDMGIAYKEGSDGVRKDQQLFDGREVWSDREHTYDLVVKLEARCLVE